MDHGIQESSYSESTAQPESSSTGQTSAHALRSAMLESPLGTMLAIADDRGILRLQFDYEPEDLDGTIPSSPGENHHIDKLRRQLADYFAGTLKNFTVRLRPAGTAFDQKSWDFLSTIPYGQTRSYGQQAQAIGNPKAARAVGGANGRNPIGIVVPCHRVIGASGTLTGFGGGLHRKRWLLDHERKFS